MRLAIYNPDPLPESFRVCVDAVRPWWEQSDIEVVEFSRLKCLPHLPIDVIWDPRSGGGALPPAFLFELGAPIVVTIHGVAPLALPWRYVRSMKARLDLWRANAAVRRGWRLLDGNYAAVVTVSEFSRRSILRHLPIPDEKLFVCGNAVDHEVFVAPEYTPKGNPYFFHISNDEPRKNLDRLVLSYRRLPAEGRWPLVLKLPRRRPELEGHGIRVIDGRVSTSELVSLYQNAGAFVFPSLYEGFGLPVLEAMACGCPVITARGTACEEVAKGAAFLVNPLSIDDMARVLMTVQSDHSARRKARDMGLAAALAFSWQEVAGAYARVFRGVVSVR